MSHGHSTCLGSAACRKNSARYSKQVLGPFQGAAPGSLNRTEFWQTSMTSAAIRAKRPDPIRCYYPARSVQLRHMANRVLAASMQNTALRSMIFPVSAEQSRQPLCLSGQQRVFDSLR